MGWPFKKREPCDESIKVEGGKHVVSCPDGKGGKERYFVDDHIDGGSAGIFGVNIGRTSTKRKVTRERDIVEAVEKTRKRWWE